MIYNKNGQVYDHEGMPFTIGGAVRSNDNSDYPGLFGIITEIRDGADIETDNDGPDIYCSFDIPVLPHEIERIETLATYLWRSPKKVSALGLDMMIMSPDEIDSMIEDIEPRCLLDVFLVVENWTIDDMSRRDEHIFLSAKEAEWKMHKLVKELKETDIVEWLKSNHCVEESENGSYTVYLDGEYTSNHYEVEIVVKKLPISHSLVNKFAYVAKEEYAMEDLVSRIESEEIEITPDELSKIKSLTDVSDRIEHRLFNCDSYWDYYWRAVDDVAEDIITEIRKTESI